LIAVLLLKKAMNGLIQGAYIQYRNVEKQMLKEGFKVDTKTPGLFVKWISGQVIVVAVWVDDFLIVFSKKIEKETREFIQRITKILLLRKTIGKLLDMELIITDDAFYLSSESYIENKVKELNPGILFDKGKFIATPLPQKQDIGPESKNTNKLLDLLFMHQIV
jgi:hypothetical protein